MDSVGQEQLTELDRRLHQSIHAIADNAVSQLFLPRIRSVLGLVFAGGSQDSAEQAKVAREAYRISAAGAATQPG